MKKRNLFYSLIILPPLFLVLGSCATTKTPLPADNIFDTSAGFFDIPSYYSWYRQ